MTNRYEFILAGSGGQGLVMMGILIGQAANEDGYQVAQSQSYGIAARGGVSYSELVLSSEPIIYPKVQKPDLILALTAETCQMFRKKYPDTRMIVDADVISQTEETESLVILPLTEYCRRAGDMRVLNLLSIGVIQGFTGCVSTDAMEQTIRARFPQAAGPNLTAFHQGIAIAEARLNR